MDRPSSRREFVLGAGSMLAAGTLAGCGAATSAIPSSRAPGALASAGGVYDVIVIGAGAAGIAAARSVRSYGRSVLVLEGQGRAGGRALTDNTTFSEVGFDLGAQFFGHVLSGNVLFGIAQARGIPVVDFSTFPTYFYLGTKKAPLSDVASFVATTGGMLSDILAAGALIEKPSQDVAASKVIKKYLEDPYYQNAIGVTVTTETGVEPNASSTLDLFNFSVGSPSPFLTPGDSYLIRSGMGNFIESLAKGLPVKYNVLVRRITRGGGGVAVETNAGTFRAKTAIVTVSTGVLGAGAIEFKPALPAATRDAIAALPLGLIYKAALGFKRNVFPAFENMTAVTQLSQKPAVTYFANFWKTKIVEFLADADIATRIEGMSRTGQIDYLLGRLEENVPGASAAFDGRMTASNWGHDPFTYGSYSHARVGMTQAREELRKGVANAIFFAGEAVAQTSTITLLQGAYNAGIAAATAALRAIGVRAV
jgi:monoamine oxidase